MVLSRPPLLFADSDGAGAASRSAGALCEAVAEGWGAALPVSPASAEEDVSEGLLPALSAPFARFAGSAEEVAEGAGCAPPPRPSPAGSPSPAEADGVGAAEGPVASSLLSLSAFLSLSWSSESSSAATQSLYSSIVRLLSVLADDAEGLLSATANVDVTPIPMRTAVGMAAMTMALPAGMWNLLNSGFLGAAWRCPDLARDSSTSAPWATSSVGTAPPVRPVGRARS